MNTREQRGLAIAALCKLNKDGGSWKVPSQSGIERTYRVNPKHQTCSCLDHIETGEKCKHLFAVEFTMKREVGMDGVVTETKSMRITETKTVYPTNAPAYNRSLMREKDRVQELLYDLCQQIEEPIRTQRGVKPHTLRDSVFAMVLKVYTTFSSRRFTCDLHEAHRRGYLSKAFPGIKVQKFLDEDRYGPILKSLIAISATPLKEIETKFAIDSSGFGSNKFERWFDEKYGAPRKKTAWVKAHISCGVKTNIVTAVRLLDKDSADSPQFTRLLNETAKEFTIEEVSADKAYTSLENFEAVANCGGQAFFAFKANTTGGVGGEFKRMFHYFQYRKEEYLKHYHLRSNVESTFSAIKRKFGDSVRSLTETAMANEALCKILAHNLCVLNREECELGIESKFSEVAA